MEPIMPLKITYFGDPGGGGRSSLRVIGKPVSSKYLLLLLFRLPEKPCSSISI